MFYTCAEAGCKPADPTEWTVDKILSYRPQDPKKKDGIPQWKTSWAGFPRSHDSWEPAESFLPGFQTDWLRWNQKHRIEVELTKCFPNI